MENWKAEVVIYTKSHCPYCVRAKELLTRKGVVFNEIYLDDKPEEFVELKKKSGLMTVPQVFINQKLVGGYDSLSQLEKDNKLDALLMLGG